MFYIYADGKSIYQPFTDDLVLLQPKLTLEMGKAGSLEFTMPPTHRYFDRLQQLTTQIVVEMDRVEIFRGRVLTNKRMFNGTRQVYCEGDLAYLVDSVIFSASYKGTTHSLFRTIVAAHNFRVEAYKRFEVGTIGIENVDISISGSSSEVDDDDYDQIAINASSSSYESAYDYIEDNLIGYCGGYLRTRREGDVTYLDLIQDYSGTAIQEIEFGKNLLDLTEEVSSEGVFTVLVPVGDNGLTIASVNGGSDELVDATAVARYGRILKAQSFSGVTNPSTLLANGRQYLATHVNTPVTLTVKAIDMHLVDKNVTSIQLGDRVRVKSIPHDIVDYLTCRKIEYDFENPSNNTYTFGNEKQSLTESYRKDKRETAKASSAKAAKASGSAARAARSGAVSDVEQKGDSLYDAWVNVDAAAGSVKIGAMFRKMEDTIAVLESQVGIDLSAGPDGGNINIKNFYHDYETTTKQQIEASANLSSETSKDRAQLSQVVGWSKTVDQTVNAHAAELTLLADNVKSLIKMVADTVTVDAMNIELSAYQERLSDTEQKVEENERDISDYETQLAEAQEKITSIQTQVNALTTDTEATFEAITTYKEGNDAKVASIEARANSLGSEIKLKADTVTIEGELNLVNATLHTHEQQIDTLESDFARINKLVTTNISSVITDTTVLTAKSLSTVNGVSVTGTNGVISAPTIKASKSMLYKNSEVINLDFLRDVLKLYVKTSSLDLDGYLKEIPDPITVTSIKLDGLVLRKGTNDDLVYNGYQVATKNWCNTVQNFATKDWVLQQLKAYAKTSHTHTWGQITNKPTSFKPEKHTHTFSTEASYAWGHTHTTDSSFRPGDRTGGVYNYSTLNKKIKISGTTNSN